MSHPPSFPPVSTFLRPGSPTGRMQALRNFSLEEAGKRDMHENDVWEKTATKLAELYPDEAQRPEAPTQQEIRNVLAQNLLQRFPGLSADMSFLNTSYTPIPEEVRQRALSSKGAGSKRTASEAEEGSKAESSNPTGKKGRHEFTAAEGARGRVAIKEKAQENRYTQYPILRELSPFAAQKISQEEDIKGLPSSAKQLIAMKYNHSIIQDFNTQQRGLGKAEISVDPNPDSAYKVALKRINTKRDKRNKVS